MRCQGSVSLGVCSPGVHQARLPRHTLSFTLVLHFVRFRPFSDKVEDKVKDKVGPNWSLMHPCFLSFSARRSDPLGDKVTWRAGGRVEMRPR